MLNIIPIAVNRQNIVCDSIKIASDLIAEVRCDFTLSAEWAEFQTVSAIFEDKYGKRIETVISDGSCVVPHEVLQHRGTVKVNLCGYKIAGETKTLQLTSFKTVLIDVLQAVNTSGDNSTEPTAPAWQQQLALRPTDAPTDGKKYARKDGEWAEVDDATDWDSITDKPSTYPPSTHSHSYDSITNKPSTYPPSAHKHTVSDISDFPSIPTDNIELANGAGYITAEALEPTKRSLDALWKLSKGQLWDIEQVECEGHAQLPSGGEYGNVDEVRGKTEQFSTNGYQIFDFESFFNAPSSYYGFNCDIVLNDKSIKITRRATGQWDRMETRRYLAVKANESIIVSAKTDITPWSGSIQARATDGTSLTSRGTYTQRPNSFTFIANEDIEILIQFYCDTPTAPVVGGVVTYSDIMIEKGTTAHDYEPYTGGIPSPNPDYPQEIVSVDSIHILHTDADGATLDERTITPPRPLNAIGEYKDMCDVVKGEWVYNTLFVDITLTRAPYTNTLGYRYTNSKVANAVSDKCMSEQLKYNPKSGNPNQGINVGMRLSVDYNTVVAEFISDEPTHDIDLLYCLREPQTEPISAEDLDFLRNLTLFEGENLFITDNHGRDVSYIMSDFINLGKVGG